MAFIMNKKLTTYQKLKAENLKLKQDIYILINPEKSDIEEYYILKTQWQMRFNIENIVWAGSY